ncbi:MAG: hypothetical protein JXR68_12280 [Bacteroidales bacterium]|nr:hypothetical protein [Bacteroidales bacterium]
MFIVRSFISAFVLYKNFTILQLKMKKFNICISEDILASLDKDLKIIALTLEHAINQTNISSFYVNLQGEISEHAKEII